MKILCGAAFDKDCVESEVPVPAVTSGASRLENGHGARDALTRSGGAASGSVRALRGRAARIRNLSGRSGAWGRIRTTDTRIFNPLLYQLSYPGREIWSAVYRRPRLACPEAKNDCRAGRSTGFVGLPRRRSDLIIVIVIVAGGGDGVATNQPALQIDVRAPSRAERPVVRRRRLGANRAFRRHILESHHA